MPPAEQYQLMSQRIFDDPTLSPNVGLIMLAFSYVEFSLRKTPTLNHIQTITGIDVQTDAFSNDMATAAVKFKHIAASIEDRRSF